MLTGKGMVWTMQNNLPKERTFAKRERAWNILSFSQMAHSDMIKYDFEGTYLRVYISLVELP